MPLSLDKLINTTGESELTFRPLYPALDAGLCFVWKKHQIFPGHPDSIWTHSKKIWLFKTLFPEKYQVHLIPSETA